MKNFRTGIAIALLTAAAVFGIGMKALGGANRNLDASTITGMTTLTIINGSGTLSLPTSTDTLTGRATTDTLTNKSINAANNTITNITDTEIKSTAAIARSKLATGTADHVLINSGTGAFSSEAQLVGTRGGTGASNAGVFSYGTNNLTFTTSGATSCTLPTTGTLATLAGTETLTNKTMTTPNLDLPLFRDTTTSTKQADLSLSGASASTKTTLSFAQTLDRTISFPNATDTLVGKATTDTFTNKTIDADGTGNSITNIEDADIKSAAAIAVNKLAALTASKAVVSDGSGFLASSVYGIPTNANTASSVVARDASGDFTAGTITAALVGNATTSSSTSGNAATATALAADPAGCTSSQIGYDVNASGTMSCATVSGDISDSAGAMTVEKIQSTTVSGTTGTTNVVFSNSPTLVTPALGTPSALVGTNISGTAASLTAGLATDTVSKTGTGSTYATNTSPTFVTPALGTPTSGVMTNVTGTAAGLTAGLATALAADPADCAANVYATAIAASGALTCASITDGSLSSNIPLKDGANTFSAANIFSVNGAASTPALKTTGSWYTGGTATTTKPQLLVEASGATTTGWDANGTGIGANSGSSFTGKLLDLQLNGTSKFSVDYTGKAVGDGSGLTGVSSTFAPIIQVKSANYTIIETDDYVIGTATLTFTLTECSGLTNKHVWHVKNSGTGVVTITAGGANVFDDVGASTSMVLSDRDTAIDIACNKGGTLYVF